MRRPQLVDNFLVGSKKKSDSVRFIFRFDIKCRLVSAPIRSEDRGRLDSSNRRTRTSFESERLAARFLRRLAHNFSELKKVSATTCRDFRSSIYSGQCGGDMFSILKSRDFVEKTQKLFSISGRRVGRRSADPSPGKKFLIKLRGPHAISKSWLAPIAARST